jgi:DNA invertase Pin-like site-specific DNA recombinase
VHGTCRNYWTRSKRRIFGGDAVDTRSATGRLMLNMFAAMAQFERETMLERQREGIAKAKAEGKCKGRKPTAPGLKQKTPFRCFALESK